MRRIDAAIAIVVRDSKVLICQRKSDDTFGDLWEFPGGKREADETLEQCLARELREEIAITARPVHAFEPIEHDYPQVKVRLHPYLCEYVEGDPQTIECQAAKWVEPIELRAHEFPPANERLIEQVIARLTKDHGHPR